MTLIDVVLLLFGAKALLFALGSWKSRHIVKDQQNLQQQSISIVIPARNEQTVLASCLDSLLQNTATNVEFIIVNDRSTDDTQSIIDAYASKDQRIHGVELTEERQGNLRGKAGALHVGILASKGEIIMMSDADCTFPNNWILSVSTLFENPKIGMVAGFTTIEAQSAFHHLQDMEWLMNHTLASGAMSLGHPLGCFGNNLSIRRSVYDSIGGYAGIPFSVTEDLQLLTSVSHAGYDILYPCNEQVTVQTKPCMDWKSFVHQQHRWVRGSEALGWKKYVFAFFAFVFWISLIMTGMIGDSVGFVSILAMRVIGDCIIVVPALFAIGRTKQLRWVLPGMMFMIYIEIMVAFLLLKKDVYWKGQVFRG